VLKTLAISIRRDSQYFRSVFLKRFIRWQLYLSGLRTVKLFLEHCDAAPLRRKKPAPAEVCDFFFDRSAATMETSFTVHDYARQ
jgi:hypothetical protein